MLAVMHRAIRASLVGAYELSRARKQAVQSVPVTPRSDEFARDRRDGTRMPHIVSNRGAARRIAFRRWRVLDRVLQFNDYRRVIVAVIAAALRTIRRAIRSANVQRYLSHAIEAVGFRQALVS
jgi:hypothetical protein